MVMMVQAPEVNEKKEKLEPAYKDGFWPTEGVKVTCHHCGEETHTACSTDSSIITWISCWVLCLIGCCLGCCLIPFCVASIKDQNHKCTKCYKPLG